MNSALARLLLLVFVFPYFLYKGLTGVFAGRTTSLTTAVVLTGERAVASGWIHLAIALTLLIALTMAARREKKNDF
jgi:hypothetical protein